MNDTSPLPRPTSGTLPEGVVLRELEPHPDARGTFTEYLCESWGVGIEPVQWSLVRSRPGVLRGMHVHLRHDEFFLLVDGRCCVGLHDIRPKSRTRGRSCLIDFSADKPTLVCFPRGLVHGWYFYEASIHVQAISEEYVEYHADDNLGCRWDDPALGLPWPETPTLLSERSIGNIDPLFTEKQPCPPRNHPAFRSQTSSISSDAVA